MSILIRADDRIRYAYGSQENVGKGDSTTTVPGTVPLGCATVVVYRTDPVVYVVVIVVYEPVEFKLGGLMVDRADALVLFI